MRNLLFHWILVALFLCTASRGEDLAELGISMEVTTCFHLLARPQDQTRFRWREASVQFKYAVQLSGTTEYDFVERFERDQTVGGETLHHPEAIVLTQTWQGVRARWEFEDAQAVEFPATFTRGDWVGLLRGDDVELVLEDPERVLSAKEESHWEEGAQTILAHTAQNVTNRLTGVHGRPFEVGVALGDSSVTSGYLNYDAHFRIKNGSLIVTLPKEKLVASAPAEVH